MTDEKRFDDWVEVECNDCERYWTDQCDGLPEGKTKPCGSYMACRKTDYAKRLRAVEKKTEDLEISKTILGIAVILLAVARLVGRFV